MRPTILRCKAPGVGVLLAIIAVRRAFGFGLAEAKGMVESGCGPSATDAWVQVLFECARRGKTTS